MWRDTAWKLWLLGKKMLEPLSDTGGCELHNGVLSEVAPLERVSGKPALEVRPREVRGQDDAANSGNLAARDEEYALRVLLVEPR